MSVGGGLSAQGDVPSNAGGTIPVLSFELPRQWSIPVSDVFEVMGPYPLLREVRSVYKSQIYRNQLGVQIAGPRDP